MLKQGVVWRVLAASVCWHTLVPSRAPLQGFTTLAWIKERKGKGGHCIGAHCFITVFIPHHHHHHHHHHHLSPITITTGAIVNLHWKWVSIVLIECRGGGPAVWWCYWRYFFQSLPLEPLLLLFHACLLLLLLRLPLHNDTHTRKEH